MPANAALLGIDLGTTVLKAAVLDAKTGALLARASQPLTVRTTRDGGREQLAASIDRALGSVIESVRKESGAAWARIGGMGVAAQGGSSMLADRNTGRPLTPMVLWNDGRTSAYTARIAEKAPKGYWQKHVLNEYVPAGLGRMHWLRERHPSLFTGANIHIGAGEYLFYRLTGTWRQDAGHAIQIGAFNASRGCLSDDPFQWSGVPLSFVAPLRAGHETSGLSKAGARLLGLAEGIPVAGPYIDQEAGYMSASVSMAHPLQVSLGTAWVGNFALPAGLKGASPFQLVIPSPVDDGRLVILPLRAGNLAWDWALRLFGNEPVEKVYEKVEEILAAGVTPPDGLTAFPWLEIENPAIPGVQGGGVYFGISPVTEPADMIRAAASGLVFEFARVFEEVRSSGCIEGVMLGGGASRSAGIRALFASLFAPLTVSWQPDVDLAAARGAVFVFSREAARCKVERVREPRSSEAFRIERAFMQYLSIMTTLFEDSPGCAPFQFRSTSRRRS